ncbi:alpha/beta hydrolase [Erwinia typographi]|uniref:Alpha/beta hydrolase n=1 Tax=Erwinia typographi TaxID=371042 RepID=A0A0A4ABA1_9GAMM|nr:alpha/beta hydrolase [Erwinia typographi]KGT95113.1 alpha/beta hydrolase [Erwinia typographi]
MKFLKANGIDVCYDSFGDENDETILLISGLGTQMIRWTELFCQSLVAEGFRVIRFDNRDAGLSTHFTNLPSPDFAVLAKSITAGQKPDVPYTLHDMAADAIGLLNALAINQAHVIGRSMGGMIAQLMASDYPQRILSLISIMSSTGNPNLPSAEPDVMAMLTKRLPNPAEDLEGYVTHTLLFANRIAGAGFAFDEESHRAIILEEFHRAYDPAGFGRQIAAIAATGDIRSRLVRIHVPTLVIHGADDALIPPACGKDTASSIHGAELLLINGMGHDLPVALYQPLVTAICKTLRQQNLG